MDLIINNLRIALEEDSTESYLQAAGRKLAADPASLSLKNILSKELNSKDFEQFFYILTVVVTVDDDLPALSKFTAYTETPPVLRKKSTCKDRPIIVGFGPAGMFAALALIDAGYKPRIFERGKPIDQRTADVQRFIKQRQLNPESNIQFGEGGAGSYSDGKLFSRRNNNSGFIHRVLQTFIRFGAPKEIEYISKPHLGTDVLCTIVRNMRSYILDRGGEIFYSSKMTDLLLTGRTAVGIRVNNEQEYPAENIYLALGHSARDTFGLLQDRGVALQQRPISVGVRIEHPAATINLMRYGKKYSHYPGLGAATYSLNYTNRKIKKGVYTFCMCPGGEIINASSSRGMLVLNGMSYSRRSSPWSNAALAVSCHITDYESDDPLAGIAFQQDIERKSFQAGGGNWAVPAQNLMDFLNNTSSTDIHSNSYRMGSVAAEMQDILPKFTVKLLKEAFKQWSSQVPLFIAHNAVVMAAETRTSSPVRILRNAQFESINTKNLFPIGEGSGYTGGITSSAADGLRGITMRLNRK